MNMERDTNIMREKYNNQMIKVMEEKLLIENEKILKKVNALDGQFKKFKQRKEKMRSGPSQTAENI